MYPHLFFLPAPEDLNLNQPENQLAYQLLTQLHHHDPSQSSLAHFLSWRLIKASLFKKDHALLQALRTLYRQGMSHLCKQLNQHHCAANFHDSFDFIYSSLCFLPFLEWQYDADSQLSIPQYINETWQQQSFNISTIELNPPSKWQALWQRPYHRTYAYALTPHDKNLTPILIFPATTYPAGAGFTTHIKADLQAFHSVGQNLFHTARPQIEAWMQEQQIQKFSTLGLSLGGGLSLLTSIHMPQHIQLSFALNPPGLYDVPTLENSPPVRVLIQANDPVSKLGYWHQDWQLEQLQVPDQHGHPAIFDHVLIYAGYAEKNYLPLNPKDQNQAHPYLNLLLFKWARTLCYFILILPIYYLVLPIGYMAWHHKRILLLTASLALLTNSSLFIPALLISIVIDELLKFDHSYTVSAIQSYKQAAFPNKILYLGLTPLSLFSFIFLSTTQACLILPLTIYLNLQLIHLLEQTRPNLHPIPP